MSLIYNINKALQTQEETKQRQHPCLASVGFIAITLTMVVISHCCMEKCTSGHKYFPDSKLNFEQLKYPKKTSYLKKDEQESWEVKVIGIASANSCLFCQTKFF